MDKLLEKFAELVFEIALEMKRNGYFRGTQNLMKEDQTFLRDVLQRRLREDRLHSALYRLTRVVAQLTKRRTIVLIDEYDTPILHAAEHNYFPDVCP
jgi:hypothetical protein